jgi:hypothetical protein
MEAGGLDHEEVTCHDRFGVTANERQTALLRIGLSPRSYLFRYFATVRGETWT